MLRARSHTRKGITDQMCDVTILDGMMSDDISILAGAFELGIENKLTGIRIEAYGYQFASMKSSDGVDMGADIDLTGLANPPFPGKSSQELIDALEVKVGQFSLGQEG